MFSLKKWWYRHLYHVYGELDEHRRHRLNQLGQVGFGVLGVYLGLLVLVLMLLPVRWQTTQFLRGLMLVTIIVGGLVYGGVNIMVERWQLDVMHVTIPEYRPRLRQFRWLAVRDGLAIGLILWGLWIGHRTALGISLVASLQDFEGVIFGLMAGGAWGSNTYLTIKKRLIIDA